ncbi:hypothetical protein BSN85_31850 [Bradyrhizobium brasilense]|uniref:hypothetical protein n=1 Tax=Bradyrhizobium brasilense TaxID=1419277 RepID=UPI0009780BAC|nr:hypothetical protein [Bradyrhizobium brasilense]OMI01606.1 hypothetical protein BSN85_31850 [Bradyrhizobium brasilense]
MSQIDAGSIDQQRQQHAVAMLRAPPWMVLSAGAVILASEPDPASKIPIELNSFGSATLARTVLAIVEPTHGTPISWRARGWAL